MSKFASYKAGYFIIMSQKENISTPKRGTHSPTKHLLRRRVYNLTRKFLIGFILVSVINLIYSHFFYTPKLYFINKQNQELVEKYKDLQAKIDNDRRLLSEIKHRDDYLYRPFFGTDSVSIPELYNQYPQSKYSDLQNDNYSALMTSTWLSLDQLTRELYLRSVSLDPLQRLASGKENLSSAIPAIWPIDRTTLKHGIGAFGMRYHPIYKRYIMHKGVDLASDKGNPVYATGDAIVQHTEKGYRYSGYGEQVLLDHGFGYKTRYAHLSKRLVKEGDVVRRGDKIGEVGSTGGSTGPHLHYEVILNNQVMNPINYFDRNMSNEDYSKLMEEMQDTNFEVYE